MSEAAVVFDHVWKRFKRGERHDSLRDLIPAFVRRVAGKTAPVDDREFWAVRDVSFEVQQGEALGIIGPNGAGKSTTLKLLTKILRPTRGECHVRGRVGALIEVASGFHQDLTGRENVFLQGAIMGMKRTEIAGKLDAIVDFAGIEEFIDTPVKRYSSGMNARLGFSIAAHLDPAVLIIDEVLSVGDMSFQERCLRRMAEFKRDGAAIVFVSHNLQAASALCDRLLLLKSSVRAIGTPDDVVRAYLLSEVHESPDEPTPARLFEFSLVKSDGSTASSVCPGDSLRLTFRCSFDVSVDDLTLGVVVTRSTDRVVAYDANFSSRELGLGATTSGQVIQVRVDLIANLTRGHYDVSCHMFHNPTQTRLADAPSAAVFNVDESRTWGGIAHLEATAHLVEGIDPLPAISGSEPVGLNR